MVSQLSFIDIVVILLDLLSSKVLIKPMNIDSFLITKKRCKYPYSQTRF